MAEIFPILPSEKSPVTRSSIGAQSVILALSPFSNERFSVLIQLKALCCLAVKRAQARYVAQEEQI